MGINTNILGAGYTQYGGVAAQAAAADGIPEPILVALIQQESSWNPAVPIGAANDTGLGQITPGVYNDGRYTDNGRLSVYDPAQNIQIAANYLAAQYKAKGNWTDALSAYNSGRTAANSSAGAAYATSVLGIAAQLGYDGTGNTNATNIGDAASSGNSIDSSSIWGLVSSAFKALNPASIAGSTATSAVNNAGAAATGGLATISTDIGTWLKDHLIMVCMGLLALLIIAYSAFKLIPAPVQSTAKNVAKVAALA